MEVVILSEEVKDLLALKASLSSLEGHKEEEDLVGHLLETYLRSLRRCLEVRVREDARKRRLRAKT